MGSIRRSTGQFGHCRRRSIDACGKGHPDPGWGSGHPGAGQGFESTGDRGAAAGGRSCELLSALQWRRDKDTSAPLFISWVPARGSALNLGTYKRGQKGLRNGGISGVDCVAPFDFLIFPSC